MDQITDGLSFEFSCNLPCLTCADDDPDFCTSCNQWQTGNFLILHDGKCNVDCPNYTYKEAYNCCKSGK